MSSVIDSSVIAEHSTFIPSAGELASTVIIPIQVLGNYTAYCWSYNLCMQDVRLNSSLPISPLFSFYPHPPLLPSHFPHIPLFPPSLISSLPQTFSSLVILFPHPPLLTSHFHRIPLPQTSSPLVFHLLTSSPFSLPPHPLYTLQVRDGYAEGSNLNDPGCKQRSASLHDVMDSETFLGPTMVPHPGVDNPLTALGIFSDFSGSDGDGTERVSDVEMEEGRVRYFECVPVSVTTISNHAFCLFVDLYRTKVEKPQVQGRS